MNKSIFSFFVLGLAVNLPRFLLSLIFSIASVPIRAQLHNNFDYWNFTSGEKTVLNLAEVNFFNATGYAGVYFTLFMGVAIASTTKVVPLPKLPLTGSLVSTLLSFVMIETFSMDQLLQWWEALIMILLPILYFVIALTIQLNSKSKTEPMDQFIEDQKEEGPLTLYMPETCGEKFLHIVLLPVKVIFFFTVVDAHRPNLKKFYLLTVLLSLLWLMGLTFIVDSSFPFIGNRVGIPQQFMSLLLQPVTVEFVSVITLSRRYDLDIAIHAVCGALVMKLALMYGIIPFLSSTLNGNIPSYLHSENHQCSFIFSEILFLLLTLSLCLCVRRSKLACIPFFLFYPLFLLLSAAEEYYFILCEQLY